MKNNITILYVDDEKVNLLLFKKSFGKFYKVITADSGEEALIKMADHKNEIKVVISDLRMPIMNGIKFIKEARKEHNNKVYFILTAFDYNDEIDHALKNKIIHRFFNKPFNTRIIQKAVHDAVLNSGLTDRFNN